MRALTPPPALLVARRALEGVAGVEFEEDWTWYPSASSWVLQCRLSPGLPTDGPIPSTTRWYVLVEPTYPWGSIKFYPAKEGGLTQTFPHQMYNGSGDQGRPWRTGDICLDTQVKVLGRTGFDSEPYEDYRRLHWRFQRALSWLAAAARGQLVVEGEAFELPAFPESVGRVRVVVVETADTFAKWQHCDEQAGRVELAWFGENVLYVKAFRALNERELLTVQWGSLFSAPSSESVLSVWWRLPGPPILWPWQVPTTWGELRKACQQQSVNIDSLIRSTAKHLRDGRKHIALVGFPIPARVGAVPCQVHWQAINLPQLAFGNQTAKGFRPNEAGRWELDRKQALSDSKQIEWLMSQNWSPGQITSRGRLPAGLRQKRILLIGAGALGSVIAGHLVRAGVTQLVVIDGELFEGGNVTRHVLGFQAVGQSKALALAEYLHHQSPHVNVTALVVEFPPSRDDQVATVQACDVILDCTGQDSVLEALGNFDWPMPKVFVSYSMGFRARRLFCFHHEAPRFSHELFRAAITPWLEREKDEFTDEDLPREGIGCWHPVFSARVDDVGLLAAIAVKDLEAFLETKLNNGQLVVYEQAVKEGVFHGARRIVG